MKTGRLSGELPQQESALHDRVVRAALAELRLQVASDASMLVAHQQVADIHLGLEALGIDPGTEFNPAAPSVRRLLDAAHEKEAELRRSMTAQAWRYHALAPQGLAARLQPLAAAVQSDEPLTEEALQADPLLGRLVEQCSASSESRGAQELLSTEQEVEAMEASFGGRGVDVELGVANDGSAECCCVFCERLFDVESVGAEALTPLQRWLVEQHGIELA